MPAPWFRPALVVALTLSAALSVGSSAAARDGDPAADPAHDPAATARALPSTVDGFAARTIVTVRLACGATLPVSPTDDRGVLHLPADLLDTTAPGRYRLLVSGPSGAAGAPVAGNVVVTVPQTVILGIRVGSDRQIGADDDVPVPRC